MIRKCNKFNSCIIKNVNNNTKECSNEKNNNNIIIIKKKRKKNLLSDKIIIKKNNNNNNKCVINTSWGSLMRKTKNDDNNNNNVNVNEKKPYPSLSAGAIKNKISFIKLFDYKQKGDSNEINNNNDKKFNYDDDEKKLSEVNNTNTNTNTNNDVNVDDVLMKKKLFKIRGPNDTGFLIEVYVKDEKEVKNQLFKLNGNRFKFDSTIINLFKKKCFLTGKLPSNTKDKTRLSKIHGIASGCENVYQINDSGEFLFINSLENVDRAKRILEKFHYCLSQTIYKFQPISNVKTNDRLTEICQDFIKSVRNLPKVLSVTHNLQLNTDDVNKII
uniref:Uncharacterized protein n=1 Tax=Pediculus humanus subsp. corporis TaxID=121224 RepID=A0A2Y9D4C3_PEDHC